MRVAFANLIGGAAGDMLLGAFIAVGLALDDVGKAIDRLDLEGYRLTAARVEKAGVPATKFSVLMTSTSTHHHGENGRRRTTVEHIERRIAVSGLPPAVIASSCSIFRCLAGGIGSVESIPPDSVRFDEREVIDNYIDIVGVSFAMYTLGIERLYSSSLPMGESVLETPHGTVHLPDPVAVAIARMASAPFRTESDAGEQVTRTGAAILATLADFDRPNMRVTRAGSGAGDADLEIPNIVRVELGETDGC